MLCGRKVRSSQYLHFVQNGVFYLNFLEGYWRRDHHRGRPQLHSSVLGLHRHRASTGPGQLLAVEGGGGEHEVLERRSQENLIEILPKTDGKERRNPKVRHILILLLSPLRPRTAIITTLLL